MKNRVTSEGRRLRPRLLSLAIAGAYAVSGAAYALPTGGQVVAGQARLERSGNTLTVSNSPGAIINWSNFSIGALESVRFEQQSALSAVLNRVVGAEASAIYGQLSSNGRVWLLNPNGILFGQGSRIDIPGFVASTLDVGSADFQAGRMNFTAGAVAGSIRNEGRIGNAGSGNLYLVAPDIQNHGVIQAENGNVLLAAGRQVSLIDQAHPDIQVVVSAPGDQVVNLGQIATRHGSIGLVGSVVAQRGQVSADRVEVDDHGRIVFRGTQRVEVASGSVTKANGPGGGRIVVDGGEQTSIEGHILAIGTSGKGGQIDVLGREIRVEGQARVDASGETGGGKVRIGGDYQGKNPKFRNAVTTYFGPDAQINVDAQKVGAGGTAILWADERTEARGRISARGGEQGGDGGFVETSAHQLSVTGARVDTRANHGKTGNWLLDPTDLYVESTLSYGGATQTGGSFTGNTNQNSILNTDINAALATSNVTLNTNSVYGGSGNLFVNAPITWTSANTLTLDANAFIDINAAITGTSGALQVGVGTTFGNMRLFDSINVDKLAIRLNSGSLWQYGGNIFANSALLYLPSGQASLGSAGNQINNLAAFAYGGFSLTNAGSAGLVVKSLSDGIGTVSGLTTGLNGATITQSAGGISLSDSVNVGTAYGATLTLNSAGAITQSSGVLTANSLSITAAGAVSLNRPGNQVSSIQGTLSSSGSLSYTQGTGNLTVNGITSVSGAIELTNAAANGNIAVQSSITSSTGTMVLDAQGQLFLNSTAGVSTGANSIDLIAGSYSCNPCLGVSANNGITLKTDALIGLGSLTASSGIVQLTSRTPTTNISIGGYGGLVLPSDFASANPITAGVKFEIGDSTHTGTLTLGATPSFNLANIGGLMLNGGAVDLLGNSLNLSGKPLYLWANTGAVQQASGSTVVASSLSVSAVGNVALTSGSGNQISTLSSATVSGSGSSFQLENSLPTTFSVGPISTNAGFIYLNTSSNLQQTGDFSSGGGNISVTSATGSINMGTLGTPKNASSGGGTISYFAQSAGQTIALGHLNAGAGNITVTASGAILDNNGAAVNATGAIADFTSQTGAGSAATLAISADTKVGTLSASACGSGGSFCQIDLSNSGNLIVSSAFAAGSGADSSVTLMNAGAVTVTGAISSSGATLVKSSSGDLTVAQGGSIGSSTSTTVESLTGEVIVQGGTISASSVSGDVHINAATNVRVMGSGGSSGSVFAGRDVYVTASNGKLYLTSVSAYGGPASIQASSPMTAYLSVPTLLTGGFVIDGVEDGLTTVSSLNPSTGIFVNGSPGIVSGTFMVQYGIPSYPVDVVLTSGSAAHTYGDNPTAIFGYSIPGGIDSRDSISGTALFTPTISSLTPAGTFTVYYDKGLVSALGASFYKNAGLIYTVNPRLLNAITASLTGLISKVYDGTTAATLGPTNFVLTGFANGDGATITKTSGQYATKNAGTGISVTVNLTAADFSPTGSTVLSNYVLPTAASGAIGTITPATLTLSQAGVTALDKVYDGNTLARFSGGALNGVIGSDVVGFMLLGNYADRHAAVGKSVSLTGVSLSGTDSGNYVVAPVSGSYTATISPNPLVTWTGSAQTGLWSDPGNWGGALPDRNNVLAVLIPAGANVTYDSRVQGLTSLQRIDSLGTFTMAGGELDVSSAMLFVRYGQSGGTLSGNASFSTSESFHKTGGLLLNSGEVNLRQTAGDLIFTHDAPLFLSSAYAPDGNIDILNYGATHIIKSGLKAKGNISVVAKSPLTIDAPIESQTGFASFTASYPGVLTLGGNASFNVPGALSFSGTGDIVGTLPTGATYNNNAGSTPLPDGSLRDQVNCLIDPRGCNAGNASTAVELVVATAESTQTAVAEDTRREEEKRASGRVVQSDENANQGTKADAKPQYCAV